MTEAPTDPTEHSAKRGSTLSIRTSATIYILATALMFVVVIGLASYTYRYALDQRERVSDWHVAQMQAAQELRYLYLSYVQAWKDILLRGHDSNSYHEKLGDFYELERSINAAIEARGREMGPGTPSFQLLDKFEHEFYQMGRLYRRALRTYNEDISDPQFAADAVTQNPIYDPASQILKLIETLEVSRNDSYQLISEEMQRFEIAIVVTMLILVFVFLLIIYYLTNRFIISSINKGISLADHISRGELENHIEIRSSTSEVDKLLCSLRRMQANIRQNQHDLIQARDEAEQSNKAKSVFLSHMSHELRTPLHAILGFGQIMQMQREALNAQQRKGVDRIMEAGQHLLDLINEILDLARIENNKLHVAIEDVELSDVISECISLTTPIAEQKSVSLVNRITADHSYTVRGDYLRVKQALVNLISNAIKYGPEHDSVVLSARSVSNRVLRIEVTDSGPGIPQEQQQVLFEPFKRLNEARNIEGTGIGLALTRQLVELMQGKVGVISKPGKGSTFWIELQLAGVSGNNSKIMTSTNSNHL